MANYLLSSHDGYGLGHVRRNVLLAQAIIEASPDAQVTLVTGVATRPAWLDTANGDWSRLAVVRVPPLLKHADGRYKHASLSFEEVISQRSHTFAQLVAQRRPDVVLIDRHPYGTAGELRQGVEDARSNGAQVVLGLRDVLDEATRVHEEIAGAGWGDVADLFADIIIYGERALCDHNEEYGLPLDATYCGWVTKRAIPCPVDHRHLVVAGGGGGDAQPIYDLASQLLVKRPDWRATILAGPYAEPQHRAGVPATAGRVQWRRNVNGFAPWFARAGAVVQMAGYNSTAEAIAAGSRPILVPRRSPRREQAIRASRLAALGLADVVDDGADGAEVAWLLDRPRRLAVDALDRAGIRLDGARRSAERLVQLAGQKTMRSSR